MKKIILTNIMALVAVVLSFTSCKPEYTTYSGPNYILFSDTLYMQAVVDDSTYFELPVVATRTCDYDRNVAVEVIDSGSNAIEGKHYSIESNTVTIKAGELRANVRVKGYHSNIEVSDSLGFRLQLIVPKEEQWDLYGTTANVLLKKACKFDINAFTGYCVVSSSFIMSYMNGVDNILTRSERDPEDDSAIIIKDYFFKGYDVKIKFDTTDVYNPLIRMDEFRFAPTSEAFGTVYGDGYLNVYQPTSNVSYYSSCEKFIFQYMTLFVPGMDNSKTPTQLNTVGTFINAVEWISDDEAMRLSREVGVKNNIE